MLGLLISHYVFLQKVPTKSEKMSHNKKLWAFVLYCFVLFCWTVTGKIKLKFTELLLMCNWNIVMAYSGNGRPIWTIFRCDKALLCATWHLQMFYMIWQHFCSRNKFAMCQRCARFDAGDDNKMWSICECAKEIICD